MASKPEVCSCCYRLSPGISCARRNATLRPGHILSRCTAAYVVGLANMNASDLRWKVTAVEPQESMAWAFLHVIQQRRYKKHQ